MKQEQSGDGLRVTDLVVERGGRTIITGLSFAIEKGQALLLTGPNGAGKTTLMRALAGLLPLAGGRISFTPEDYAKSQADPDDEVRLSEHCHYVGHSNAAKPELTVAENLRFWTRFLGGGEGAEVAAMESVGLAALSDIPVRYLSAGQQRRVAIGRLLVAHRPIWLLDEPTVSLDQANTARLMEFGNEHLAGGGMIVAATHIPLALYPMTELRLEPADTVAFGNDIWIEQPGPAQPGAGL